MTERGPKDSDVRTRETDPPPAPALAPTAPEHPLPKRDDLTSILSAGREKEAPPEPATVSDGLKTPDEHAADLKVPAWLHAMARQLHGWHEHEHHEGKPKRMSKSAYTEALKAANETNPERQGKPSKEAVSPHRGKGL